MEKVNKENLKEILSFIGSGVIAIITFLILLSSALFWLNFLGIK